MLEHVDVGIWGTNSFSGLSKEVNLFACWIIPTEDGALKKILLVGDDVGRHGGGEGLDALNDGGPASPRRNRGC